MLSPRQAVVGAATGVCLGGGLLVASALGSPTALAGAAAPLLISVTATGVTPGTATPAPGSALAFVNRAANPVVVSRTATPFALAVTLQPGTTSTPTAVPTAIGNYSYTAQTQAPSVLGIPFGPAGSPLPGVIAVTAPTAAQTSAGAVAPGPVGPAPASSKPSTSSPAPSTMLSKRPSRRATAKASSPRATGAASGAPSTATSSVPTLAAPGQAGGGFIPPAPVPTFADGSAVPLPELPTDSPTVTPTQLADAPAPDAVSTAPSTALVESPSTYPPEASTFGVGDRPGPRRDRGLPIALAVVLLLGVGSGVARAASLGRFVTRTTLLPRKVRGR